MSRLSRTWQRRGVCGAIVSSIAILAITITGCPPADMTDSDGDGVVDSVDNCPNTANADQADADGDGVGDVCDTTPTDTDGDGVPDSTDNCPNTANADQADFDDDGVGDVCEEAFDQTTASYVGTQTCGGCHAAIAAEFANNGHQYKLNKVENGEMPTYPFSDLTGVLARVTDDDAAVNGTADPGVGTDNTLGTPASWGDVTYVIGGFGWKARFIDADGYIVTGSAVQYNLETDGLSGYHNNEVDKKYNCGNCHTTGWKRYTSEDGDSRNLNRQDDLPGMDGTFFAPGVHCEACHGAGSAHVAAAGDPTKITKVATPRTTAQFLEDNMGYGLPAACSDCHTRNGEKDYPDYEGGDGTIAAKGGLIRHHEQYDELQGINPDSVSAGATGPHKGLACTACHNQHTTTIYQSTSGDDPGVKVGCTSCHTDIEIMSTGMANLDCTDCHMPQLTKSAVSHASAGNGPTTGDISTHIFRIDLSKSDQFTEGGSKAYPWITAEFACLTCHNDDPDSGSVIDFVGSDLSGRTIHQ